MAEEVKPKRKYNETTLNKEQKEQLKELYNTGNYSQSYLAKKFGVSNQAVSRYLSGKKSKSWSDFTPEQRKKRIEYLKNYRKNHRDTMNQIMARWKSKGDNKEVYNKKARERYYQKLEYNRKRNNEYQREYYKKHPEKFRAKWQRANERRKEKKCHQKLLSQKKDSSIYRITENEIVHESMQSVQGGTKNERKDLMKPRLLSLKPQRLKKNALEGHPKCAYKDCTNAGNHLVEILDEGIKKPYYTCGMHGRYARDATVEFLKNAA